MENKIDTQEQVNQGEEKESFAHKAGDAIEHVGQKVTKAGLGKVGDAIYDAGDKLEHSEDDKKQDLDR